MSRSCGKSFSTAAFHNRFSSTYLFSTTGSLLPSGIPRQRMRRSRTQRHRSSQASPRTLFFCPSQFSCRVSKQAGRISSRSGVFEEKVPDILLGDLVLRAISRRSGLNIGTISFTQTHDTVVVEERLGRKKKPDMPDLYIGQDGGRYVKGSCPFIDSTGQRNVSICTTVETWSNIPVPIVQALAIYCPELFG
jgi:hypothetical protein